MHHSISCVQYLTIVSYRNWPPFGTQLQQWMKTLCTLLRGAPWSMGACSVRSLTSYHEGLLSPPSTPALTELQSIPLDIMGSLSNCLWWYVGHSLASAHQGLSICVAVANSPGNNKRTWHVYVHTFVATFTACVLHATTTLHIGAWAPETALNDSASKILRCTQHSPM